MRIALLTALFVSFAAAAPAQETRALFNGENLDGWHVVNGAPSTWKAKDGMIVCSGIPTGVMRTERMYRNFIFEMEYRHMKEGGNAGLFVWSDPLPIPGSPFTRSIEVQVMDGINTDNFTSHGDIFSIQGASMKPDRPHPNGWARCLPSERRAKPAGEWNHYKVTCREGSIKLEVNGKEVSGGFDCIPRVGYICLESEGSEVHFRNLKVTELPETRMMLPPEMVAHEAQGFRPLYNGVDLAGWKVEMPHRGHWRASDWKLAFDGQGPDLWSKKEFGDFQMVCDWRWTAEPKMEEVPVVLPNGDTGQLADGREAKVLVPVAGDSGIYLRGSSKSQVNMWCWPIGSGEVHGYRNDKSMDASVRKGVTPRVNADAPIGKWNRFIITMKGDRLTVELNGQTVLDNAQLPGVAAKGPIALQAHGSPLEFANVYIREL